MKRICILLIMTGLVALGANAQTVNGSISRDAQAAAPRVLKISGVLLDASAKPVNGEVEVTFALYKQEGDEEPLWTETQRLIADERGGYTALLGATQASGIPAEVFRSDEARWLGVQVQGQVQQPRTLLVSVPYALKAVEAEKLAGKPASDFVLSENLGDQVRRVIEGQTIVASQATSTGTPQPGQTKANSTSTAPTTAASPMFPPVLSPALMRPRSCGLSKMAAVTDCMRKPLAPLETARWLAKPHPTPPPIIRMASSALMPAQDLVLPG